MDDLFSHLEQIHTTDLGKKRIRRNLSLGENDVVSYCLDVLKKKDVQIARKGKNWYVWDDNCIFTIHAQCFTIITAHKKKR